MNPYTKQNGGPAFPISIPGVGDNGAGGMTLRDYFAAQVIGHLAAVENNNTVEADVRAAYRYADLMISARSADDHNRLAAATGPTP